MPSAIRRRWCVTGQVHRCTPLSEGRVMGMEHMPSRRLERALAELEWP